MAVAVTFDFDLMERALIKKVGLILLLVLPILAFQAGKSKYYKLSDKLELTRPEPSDYRKWFFAGSSVIPDDKNNGKALFPGIHHVYIDPDSHRNHQEKDAYPDGTILVMESHHIDKGESVGGYGYFTTGGMDILVSIKDRRAFPGNGWGYFLFEKEAIKSGKALASPEDNRCTSCHQAGAEEDEVFSQYFPDLRQIR